MNYMRCQSCKKQYRILTACPHCGETQNTIHGDLHLYSLLGVDAYIDRFELNGTLYLLIKKPSGQVWIELSSEDVIQDFPKIGE